jgi:hypothetical protein
MAASQEKKLSRVFRPISNPWFFFSMHGTEDEWAVTCLGFARETPELQAVHRVHTQLPTQNKPTPMGRDVIKFHLLAYDGYIAHGLAVRCNALAPSERK